MRDERYVPYDDGRGYAAPDAGQYTEYGDPAVQNEAGRERPARQPRPRRTPPAPQGGLNRAVEVVVGVAGGVVGAVGNLFGGVAGKVRSFSASRAQGRVQIEDDDYLGVGAPCRMCGNPVDRLQARCPHCGARVKPVYRQVPFWIGVAVLVALVVVLTMAITSCKTEQANNPGPAAEAPVATTPDELQKMVTEAENTLAAQAVSHEYTRLSAFKAQQAVDAAKNVLSSGTASEQMISDASKSLSAAVAGLTRVAEDSAYTWPYASDVMANLDSYLGKQIALAGKVTYADWPADGTPGWSQMTLTDGSTLGIGVYPADAQSQFAIGQDITVYGVLNTDGTTYAFWADKVEVF